MSPRKDYEQETKDRLAAANFPNAAERLTAAAEMAKTARNRVGQYGSANGKPTLLDRRAEAMAVLRLVYDWTELRLCRLLDLHRAMVHSALTTQVVDQRKIPDLPDWSEDDCVDRIAGESRSDAPSDSNLIEKAIRVLHFKHGWTKVSIAQRIKGVDRETVQEALRPTLLEIHQLPDWTEDKAEREARALEREIRKQRKIWYAAQDIRVDLATEMMNGVHDGRSYSNADVCALTGMSSPTVAQDRRGTSNAWKKTQRKIAQKKPPKAVDSAKA